MKDRDMEYQNNSFDLYIRNVHHIGIDYNGNYYSVIFGEYINGGFFSIPNHNCGGELAQFSDVFWNTEAIYRSIKNKKVATKIAQVIADYMELENRKDLEHVSERLSVCNKLENNKEKIANTQGEKKESEQAKERICESAR